MHLTEKGSAVRDETTQKTAPRQFTVKSLLFWNAYIAIALLAWTRPEPITMLTIGILHVVLLVSTNRVSPESLLLTGLLWVWLLCFASSSGNTQRVRQRSLCSSNLRQIGLALLHYEQDHGCFPPAFTIDENGKPLHSWRTLILPYIEEDARYRNIDLSLPWSHPKNLANAKPTPACFQCSQRLRSRVDDGKTSYIGVVGEGLLFNDSGNGTLLSEVSDGTSNTISAIELKNHRVHWMSPRDLSYENFLTELGQNRKQLLESHNGGCNVVRCDGPVSFLRTNVPKAALESALEIADGNVSDF